MDPDKLYCLVCHAAVDSNDLVGNCCPRCGFEVSDVEITDEEEDEE